jgi:putative FmdB family regulatory protein
MPIYEYVCQACGAESEIMQKLSEPPAKECPVCHKKKLKKSISAAGFRLSGGGWYETDFKSGNKRNLSEKGESKPDAAASEKPGGAAKAETKSEAKAETKTEAKAETKSEAKTESKDKGNKGKPKAAAA